MTDSTYKNEIVAALLFTENTLHKAEMEYHGKMEILLEGYNTFLL